MQSACRCCAAALRQGNVDAHLLNVPLLSCAQICCGWHWGRPVHTQQAARALEVCDMLTQLNMQHAHEVPVTVVQQHHSCLRQATSADAWGDWTLCCTQGAHVNMQTMPNMHRPCKCICWPLNTAHTTTDPQVMNCSTHRHICDAAGPEQGEIYGCCCCLVWRGEGSPCRPIPAASSYATVETQVYQ